MAENETTCGLKFHPPKLWGLDFHFNTFNKLYISDILQMQPYPMFPGAFAYGNHPMYKVDILGVVVRRDEKAKVFLYAVDDGTGVISCCCWKQPFFGNNQQSLATASSSAGLPAGLHNKLAMMVEEEKMKSEGYQLGDLLHIRGKLKTFRNMMEVVASYHRRIDNPSIQVSRMMELPLLYRQCYDKPFTLPYKVARELEGNDGGPNRNTGHRNKEDVLRELGAKIEEVLSSQQICEFSVSTLLDDPEISHLAGKLAAECDRTTAVQQSLRRLEEERGTVTCRRHVTPQYESLSGACPLDGVVVSLLQKECSKPKYAERGCHYLHLLDELHGTVQYSGTHVTALLHVLARLETDSEVIRVTDRCYHPL